MEWIYCEEKLPSESDGNVLICFPNTAPYLYRQPYPGCAVNCRVQMGQYSQHSKRWYVDGGVSNIAPIAWMPLPTPPADT